ncbi:MAG: hypothetical protein WA432_03275 [Candidatus Babeliaceae bacterium]
MVKSLIFCMMLCTSYLYAMENENPLKKIQKKNGLLNQHHFDIWQDHISSAVCFTGTIMGLVQPIIGVEFVSHHLPCSSVEVASHCVQPSLLKVTRKPRGLNGHRTSRSNEKMNYF